MSEPDYDDPDTDADWCSEARQRVFDYLDDESVLHGRIGEWPAWHVAPYASIWAVESANEPDRLGYWVVCGDLPCDWLPADEVTTARDAMRAFAQRWRAYVESARAGSAPDDVELTAEGADASEMLEMLESRAATLAEWADDDAFWTPDD